MLLLKYKTEKPFPPKPSMIAYPLKPFSETFFLCSVSSFKCVQWAPKDASFLQQSAFWPFKVIQGRFWYQSKARTQLPTCTPLWLGSYLAPFMRYGDFLAKNCLFFLPSVIRRPHALWDFVVKLTMRKLRVMGLSSSEDHVIVACRFDMIPDCDRQTGGRQTESIIANTALCIASYADAL